ncbi:uncharacterized protein SPPG_05497 [Spizellomyces punctatus DAOM BR117]|uniref:Phosphodiesterase n=1 Tax=Spizellomyces punctatus (strain DAOM BR117) TaxID=645134 RepID=A0A0L0HE02_SPIPD|nr:uncharacterized protein SPPG_05497 [Spizellomyces punctatus DAOM BR117]KNC99241.1 hypothetical protein SPPG_05497 [Spizellomyces punctatus DAOM BR117]|eukprot:XP_016607281.1 hypothetical protein SPPG_05497 [Spizellomyces punctatus DAOM BR117]
MSFFQVDLSPAEERQEQRGRDFHESSRKRMDDTAVAMDGLKYGVDATLGRGSRTSIVSKEEAPTRSGVSGVGPNSETGIASTAASWDFPMFGPAVGSITPSVTKSHPSSLFRRFTSGVVFPEDLTDSTTRGPLWNFSWNVWRKVLMMKFEDTEREREYERWFWATYHRRWAGVGLLMGSAVVCVYAQYIVLAFVSDSRGCAALTHGWCPLESNSGKRYNWLADLLFLVLGNGIPFGILFVAYRYAHADVMSRICQQLFCTAMIICVVQNYILRPKFVDPEGDIWNYGLLNLICVFAIPSMACFPAHMTLLFGIIDVACYAGIFWDRLSAHNSLSYIFILWYLVVGTAFSTWITRVVERTDRRQFIVASGLKSVNEGLKNKLKGLQKQYSLQAADLDSPLEKAIQTVKSVMANPSLDTSTFKHLSKVLGWLSDSDRLFTPELGKQLSGGFMGLDQEQEAWLLNLLPGQNKASRRGRLARSARSDVSRRDSNVHPPMENVLEMVDEGGGRPSKSEPPIPRLPGMIPSMTTSDQLGALEEGLSGPDREMSRSQSSVQSGGRPSVGFPNSYPLLDLPHLLTPVGALKERELRRRASLDRGDTFKENIKVRYMLSTVDHWSWSIFEFEALTGGRPLTVLGMHLMQAGGLGDRLKIPMDRVARFLRKVEAVYRPEVPYHNATHAADVLQAIHCFIKTSTLNPTDLECFAAYLAAIIHDLDHPGVNNNFLIVTQNPKAILYNDRSVLENHHLATGFSIMLKEENNILAAFSTEDARKVREQVIDMVMATDMAGHFTTLAMFKNKVSAAGTFDPQLNPDDRALLFRMLIKCADVSNLTREWPVYCAWLDRLIKEFASQGDEEKRLGLPVSPYMDRDNMNIPQSQLGFIEFLCQPMLETVHKVTPLQPMIDTLIRNKDILLNMRERDNKKKMLTSRLSLSLKSGQNSVTAPVLPLVQGQS